MPQALILAAELSPELRLAQAISEFKRELSPEQKRELLQEPVGNPSPDDVMRLTAKIDREMLKQGDRRCFGPRMTSFLQGIQQFASIGDVIVGGSQFLPACGVWTLVRLSLLSIVQQKSYVDGMSRMFMEIGRSAPSYQRMALLFPQSKHLQDNVVEYLIRVVHLCHRMLKHSKKSGLAQFFDTMMDGSGADRRDLEIWSFAIRDEMEISSRQAQQEENRRNSKFRSIQRQNNKQTLKEVSRLRILDAISTYDYQSTWKQLRKFGNTTVLASNDKYSAWKSRLTFNILYLTGQLGAGKSVVMACMVDDLFLSFPKGSALIAYFFCRHDIKESLTTRTIIGAIARQLLKDQDMSVVPSHLVRDQLWEEEITTILQTALPPRTVMFVVLDGFYDCDTQVEEDVSSFLKDLQLSFGISICISTRMRREVTIDSPTNPFSMVMPRNNPDIPIFIEQELERLLMAKILVIRDPQLILEIRDQITLESRDMFLWVSLQLLLLCSETTDDGIRKMLKELPLPSDLAITYSRLLNRPTSIKNHVRIAFLNLVLAAVRPLTIQELQEGLSVTPGDVKWDITKMVNDLGPILAACSGFIVRDEEQETIRLVHPSAVQFLQQSPEHLFGHIHGVMAFTIFTYLSYPQFETSLSNTFIPEVDATLIPTGIFASMLPTGGRIQQMAIKLLRSRVTTKQDISKVLAEQRQNSALHFDFQFQHYARRNWLEHLCKAEQLDPVAVCLVNSLIESEKLPLHKDSSLHNLSIPDIGYTQECAVVCRVIQQNYTAVARFLLLNTTIDLNDGHSKKIHPLMSAIQQNQLEMVKLILQICEIPRVWSHYPQGNPLEVALRRKLYDIATVLIQSGHFDPNAPFVTGLRLTPLGRAVMQGETDSVRFLLKCPQVDKDMTCAFTGPMYRTALQYAVIHSSDELFELLLDEVDVKAENDSGESVLIRAVRADRPSRISKLLLKDQLDPNLSDRDGRTALHIACKLNDTAIAEMLISDSRVDLNRQDAEGRTPLSLAAGHENRISAMVVLRKLLSRGQSSLKPNLADKQGWTPLHWAALRGNKEAVRELLKAEGIDPTVKDKKGRTLADLALQLSEFKAERNRT